MHRKEEAAATAEAQWQAGAKWEKRYKAFGDNCKEHEHEYDRLQAQLKQKFGTGGRCSLGENRRIDADVDAYRDQTDETRKKTADLIKEINRLSCIEG